MQVVKLTIGFVVLSALFGVLESLWPSLPQQRRLRPGIGTDLIYWFFTPLVTRSVSLLVVLVALLPMLFLLGHRLEQEEIRQATAAGHGPILLLPSWLQAILIVVFGDFIEYWSHRLFHSRCLWRFHAIHHSSKQLDWLSAVRLHPVNDVGTRLLQTIPFVLVGFSPTVVAAYLPFLTFYAIAQHANVSWTFGPFRYVLASPTFHRWHHTKEEEGLDKNFAGLFPVFDLLFGTFYFPTDRRPVAFGVHDDSVPEGFVGQMLYPFHLRPTSPDAEAAPPVLSLPAEPAVPLSD